MITAAGLGLAIAVEEGPIAGKPVAVPDGVLFANGLADIVGEFRKGTVEAELLGEFL